MLSHTYKESVALLAADVNHATFRGWRAEGVIPGLQPGDLDLKTLLIIALAKELSAAGLPKSVFGRIATATVNVLVAQPDELTNLLHAPQHELRRSPLMLLVWRDAAGVYQSVTVRQANLAGVRQYAALSLGDILGPVVRSAGEYAADLDRGAA